MGRCRCPSPAERDSGPSLSFRHAETVSASGRADQPAATATKSTPWSALRRTRWRTGRAPTGRTRRAGRQRALDAEDVQRHPVRWRPCVGGPAERVLSSAVLDHDHAETIVSEDTVQPAVGQIKGCEQSGPGHTASGQLVQHLQGERRHAVQRGKHMDRALPRSLQSVLVGTKPGDGLQFLLRRLRRARARTMAGRDAAAFIRRRRLIMSLPSPRTGTERTCHPAPRDSRTRTRSTFPTFPASRPRRTAAPPPNHCPRRTRHLSTPWLHACHLAVPAHLPSSAPSSRQPLTFAQMPRTIRSILDFPSSLGRFETVIFSIRHGRARRHGGAPSTVTPVTVGSSRRGDDAPRSRAGSSSAARPTSVQRRAARYEGRWPVATPRVTCERTRSRRRRPRHAPAAFARAGERRLEARWPQLRVSLSNSQCPAASCMSSNLHYS